MALRLLHLRLSSSLNGCGVRPFSLHARCFASSAASAKQDFGRICQTYGIAEKEGFLRYIGGNDNVLSPNEVAMLAKEWRRSEEQQQNRRSCSFEKDIFLGLKMWYDIVYNILFYFIFFFSIRRALFVTFSFCGFVTTSFN